MIISSKFPLQYLQISSVFLEKNDDQSDTHVPSSLCTLTTSILAEHDYKLFCYSGKNVMEEFFAHMRREEEQIKVILSHNVEMDQLTPKQQMKHEEARTCITCNNELSLDRPKTKRHVMLQSDTSVLSASRVTYSRSFEHLISSILFLAFYITTVHTIAI